MYILRASIFRENRKMKDKNIGQEGLSSIRINGSKIENLPLGQGESAKNGLSEFIKTDKETTGNPEHSEAINELLKRFPPYNIKALEDQITQFEESIDRCNNVIEKEFESIAEFTKNLALVQQRDRELKAIK